MQIPLFLHDGRQTAKDVMEKNSALVDQILLSLDDRGNYVHMRECRLCSNSAPANGHCRKQLSKQIHRW